VLALDLGSKRIGVAVSDPTGTLASPHSTMPRGRDHDVDHAALGALVLAVGAERVVVGLPRSLDGSLGPAARAVEAEVAELSASLPVPVETYDERFTTVTAHQLLGAGGRSARARRGVVDQAAATVLLQAWLDGRRPIRDITDNPDTTDESRS
jgi:putative Holliday junction resolvase